MRNWMKQLNRVIVLALMLVCLFGCIGVKAEAGTYHSQGKHYIGQNGVAWENSKDYYAAKNGTRITNAWVKSDAGWYFMGTDGWPIEGWHIIDGNDYYFAGYLMQTGDPNGWLQLGGFWFNFDKSSGAMRRGWHELNDSYGKYWFYFDGSGHMVSGGWKDINGGRYYIDEKGHLLTTYNTGQSGWIQLYNAGQNANAYFYVNPSGGAGTIGKMHVGWLNDTYFMYDNKVDVKGEPYQYGQRLHSNWYKIGDYYYHFATNGVKDTHWYNDINGYYYLGSNGQMVTGLKTLSAVDNRPAGTYYFRKSENNQGVMETNYWHKEGNTWYYFGGDGRSITNKLTVKNTISGTSTPFKYRVTIWSGGSPKEIIKQEEFELSHNGTKEFKDIPTNAIYTVEQITTPSGYVKKSGGASNATLDSDKTVTFANTQQVKLTVTNTVEGAIENFTYTIVIGSKTYNNVSLGNGTWISPDVFDHDTPYSVTQTPDDAYTTTTPSNAKGNIAAGVTVAFKNVQKKYTLTVTNTSDVAGEVFEYSVMINNVKQDGFTLKHGEKKEFTNIPHGTSYVVTQVSKDGYTTTYKDASGTMDAAKTAAFTNTLKRYTLTVTNTVDGDTEKEFSYSVTIGGVDKGTFTLKHGGTKTFDNIPHGSSYTVTQVVDEGYTMASTNATGTMNSAKTAAFTNTQKKYTLTVTNTVTGDAEKEFSYSVTIGGVDKGTFTLKHGQTKTFENIPHGSSYTVTQVVDEGYTMVSTNAEGTVTSAATAAFTNTQRRLKLKVTNVVPEGLANPNMDYSFAVIINGEKQTVTLKANTSWESDEFPYGTSYSVVQEDYSAQGITTENGVTEGKLESSDDTVEVTVTNTQETSVLKVINDLSGNDAPFSYTVRVKYADGSDFPLAETDSTFTLRAGGVKEITIPKNATYTIEQTGPENYTYRADTSESVEGNVGDGATVTFKNTQLLTLTIINNVVGVEGAIKYKVTIGEDDPFELSPENNTSTTVEIPYNSKYSIEKTVPDELTFITQIEGKDSNTEGMVADHEVTFNNTQLVTLTLNAQVIGSMANEEQPFAFQVDLYTGEGETTTPVKAHTVTPSEGVTVEGDNGQYTMSMKAGQNVAFTVPYGTGYIITQNAVDGYITSIDGVEYEEAASYTAPGTLEDDVIVTFTNEKPLAIPTGVGLAVLPFLGMVSLGAVVGVGQLLSGSRKSRRGRYLDR